MPLETPQPQTRNLQSSVRGRLIASVGLCLLVVLSYLPVVALGLTTNPLYFDSGLATQITKGPLPGTPSIDPNVGHTTQALGRLSANEWLRGNVPWWNPYAGVGLPLAAEMQSESFFLPFVLLLHFEKGIIYLHLVLQIIAGLGTLALLLQLRLGVVAAFLGGLLYAFNGTFAWFGHGGIMPLPFLPFLLLGIEKSFQTAGEKKRGGWALIALAIAYSIYSGFPETAYINGLLALSWAVLRCFAIAPHYRWAFVTKVITGGVAGILLSGPLLIPFFEYLQHSAVSHNNFSDAGLPKSSLLQLVLPYVYGPINAFIGADQRNELLVDWGNIGGYFGVTLVFLALLGLRKDAHERGLRILLMICAALLVARSVNFVGTNALFRLIPGMNFVAVFRYGSAASEMAFAILAAFAVDDWRRGAGLTKTRVLASAAATSFFVLIGFVFAKPLIGRMLSMGKVYRPWLIGSLLCAGLLLVCATILCAGAPNAKRVALLLAVVSTECIGMYALPLLSGLRGASIDSSSVAFLRSHLGHQRAYALGTMHPNYGSYFQVPFINYLSLPVSDTWVNHIRRKLDPDIDGVVFSGDYPGPLTARGTALRMNRAEFEGTGVRYVIAPHETDPFANRIVIPHQPDGNRAIFLGQNRQVSGTLPKPRNTVGVVEKMAVLVGLDAGQATGVLHLQICSDGACSAGHRELAGGTDNAPLTVTLDHPLAIRVDSPLSYKLTQTGAQHPAAIWMWPAKGSGANATLPDGQQMEAMPDVSLSMRTSAGEPKPVFQSMSADIFELRNAAPYFQVANGGCSLIVESRTSVQTWCRVPDTLIRRELFYPGWRTTVNGRTAGLGAQSIFQALTLPSGHSHVEFQYRPTHLTSALIAAFSGLVMLLAGTERRLA